MSDDYLKIIPDDPDFIPDSDSKNQAIILLGSIFDGSLDISSKVFTEVSFIGPGSNFESVFCPSCSSKITDWWSKEMDNLIEDKFSSLDIKTPCCQSTLSMNDLDYHFHAGFAKFVIEIRNPSIGGSLGDSIIRQVESLLGCKVHQIMAHY